MLVLRSMLAIAFELVVAVFIFAITLELVFAFVLAMLALRLQSCFLVGAWKRIWWQNGVFSV